MPNCGCTWLAGSFFVKSRASVESPGPDLTVGAWLTDFFCLKSKGVRRGDFVTLIRVSSQKAVQSQGILPQG